MGVVADLLRIIEQIETRVREMENVTMTTGFVPAAHPLVAANQLALSNYAKAVKGRRGQHTAGSPHLHVAAAVFGAIHAHGVPEAADAGARRRFLAFKFLYEKVICTQSKEEMSIWVRSFRVASMFHREGTQARARVNYALRGSIRVPSNPDAAEEVLCHTEGGEPEAEVGVEGRTISIEALITTMLCVNGGERAAGRAPQGVPAQRITARLKRLGLGKGKGSGKGTPGGGR